jgi:photosystem II stability/assembly factor-like uncharacterized protein
MATIAAMHHKILCINVLLLICGLAGAAETPPGSFPPANGWQAVGWGGGALYFAAAWHPTDENVLYLGGDCAGAYRSTDKGQHWRFANQGIHDYAVYSLAVSSVAPNLVYMLTDGGLSKSVDGAKTWEYIADSDEKKLDIRSSRENSVRAIAIDPINADIVYVGSRSGKLFKSINGGASWRELPYRTALATPASPAFIGAGALVAHYGNDPASSDAMGRISRFFGPPPQAKNWSAYQKISVHVRTPAGAPGMKAALAIQSGDAWQWQQGAWASIAAGSWGEATLELGALKAIDSVRMIHVVFLSADPAWQGDILVDAVALHADATGSVHEGHAPEGQQTILLDDWEKGGDVSGWTANRDAKDSRHIVSLHQSQQQQSGDVVSSVAVSPSEAATVFVTNTKLGIFRSDDAGSTWTAVTGLQRALHVAVMANDPNAVWAACAGAGLMKSADRGRTWVAVHPDGSKDMNMLEVALPAARPGLIYAIGNRGWNGGLFRSEDGGATWSKTNKLRIGMPGNPTLPTDPGSLSMVTNIAVNPKAPDELFIAANWRNVFSSDGGRTLEERSTGADNTCVTDIQFLDGRTLVTAMDEGLLESDDHGGSWRQLLPLKWDDNVSGHFWRVSAAAVDGAMRLVTTSSPWKSFNDPTCANRVFISSDAGKAFTMSVAGLPDYVPNVNCAWGRSMPRALAQDPGDPAILYLGMDGDPEPARHLPGGGIFRSADGGRTWVRCPGQPGGLRMYYGLAVDPTDSKRLFWSCCGTGGGVWRSEDSGATWAHVSSDEPWCFNLAIAPSGMILAGGLDLHVSRDHGTSWTKLTAFSGEATVIGIAIDPADEKRLWISRTSWDSSTKGGIYRTLDGGKVWEEITGDIPFRKPQLLRYDAARHELWAGGVGLFKLAQ